MEAGQRIDALSPEQRELLLRLLRERTASMPAASSPDNEIPRIPEDPFDPQAPSPLSDAQAAFWMGGSGLYDLGGSSANLYLEYEVAGNAGELAGRLNLVLARTVARHPMLRAVVSADGMQRILAEVPPYEVELVNLSRLSDAEIERHLESTRERLRYARHPTDRWPLFDMIVHQLPGEQIRFQARFHAGLVDGTSRALLIDELVRGVLDEEEEAHPVSPPPLEVSYLDFLRALRAFRDSATWQRSRAYWLARLPALPAAPRLPLARDFGPETVPRIVWRHETILSPAPWAALCRRAAQRGLTPNGMGTALLAETLRTWSEEPSFTLGLASSYHPPVHPQIRQVIGTFTALYLLEATEAPGPFADRARRLQERINADLEHQHFSGHEALRELNRTRRSGGRATLPIHFTSILRSGTAPEQEAAVDEPPPETEREQPADRNGLRRVDLMIALPQVLLFWVLGEAGDRSLFLISQAVEELFPPGLVTDLIDAYRRLAARLAEDDTAWSEPRPLRLPAALPAEPEPPVSAASEFARLAGLGPGERLLALSLPGSSLALCEIEAARMAGASVVLAAADERTPGALAALAVRERVTVWSSAPALLEAALCCMETDRRLVPTTLHRVLLHRDHVPAGLPGRLRALGLGVQAFATWGTAGAPLAAAVQIKEAAATGSCLSLRATAGWHLHVLDRDLTPRPVWVPGDLYLSGGAAAEPLQAAGERARWLPDGRIELLGNEPPAQALGYGADPRRVEAALQRHPSVRHALAAWRNSEHRLVAWLLLHPGDAPSDHQLCDHLRATFPEHLLPAVFVRLDELPLTPEGHVDRAALEAPAPAPRFPDTSWSPREIELAGLWEEVLGQRPATPDDDFFALGGTSLLATRLLGRAMGAFGLDKPLARFLDRPTLACLTELVDQALAEKESRAVPPETTQGLFLRGLRTRWRTLRERLFPLQTSPAYNMRLYLLLWFSQFVSGVGTGLGSFALGVWVYRQNASATQYSMLAFVATCTALLVAPLAGVLADRWDRKRLILFGDSGAAMMTGLMALALYTGQMRLWHVYFIVVFMVGFGALQGPALIASTSMLVSRHQLGRVSGMTQAAGIATGLICPPLSGALVPIIGYHGVIAIDISTFLFAFVVLLCIRLPRPAATAAGLEHRSILGDFRFGWDYLRQRPGLLSLLWVFAATNFALSIVQVLLTPLILSFGSATNLGFVNSATAAGGLIGSLVLGIWGGPRNRVNGILLFLLLQAPVLLLGALHPNVMLIAAACFVYTALSPLVGGLSQTIWQSKVAHEIQGRVFAMRSLIISAAAPLAFLLAGPLADRVFEPLMAPGGALAGTIGQLIGVGKGRGVGLLFIALGLFTILVVALFSLNPRLRKVESELPDAFPDTASAPEQEARLQRS
jgi:non-ribosomal peptide synthetase component F/MFS family permease